MEAALEKLELENRERAEGIRQAEAAAAKARAAELAADEAKKRDIILQLRSAVTFKEMPASVRANYSSCTVVTDHCLTALLRPPLFIVCLSLHMIVETVLGKPVQFRRRVIGPAAHVSNHHPLTSITLSQYAPDSCVGEVVGLKFWALVAATIGDDVKGIISQFKCLILL